MEKGSKRDTGIVKGCEKMVGLGLCCLEVVNGGNNRNGSSKSNSRGAWRVPDLAESGAT